MAASCGREGQSSRRAPNPLLSTYYGVAGEGSEARRGNTMEVSDGRGGSSAAPDDDNFDPFDIDRQHFNPDLYLTKLLKDYSLTELIDRKEGTRRQIVSLDSDMKTLVYENYNKFISATDTIRKMKSDFCKMEDEMDRLASNMAAITEFSGKISGTLHDRRQQINKLSNVHSMLRKLQFLFELPSKLKSCIQAGAYGNVVRYYVKAQQVLHQYQHMPSFEGIRQDCDAIIVQLKEKLREQFQNKDATPKQLAESVNLLLQLNEPAENLCDEFLAHAHQKLSEDLIELEKQSSLFSGDLAVAPAPQRPSDAYTGAPLDILAFIDLGCNQFLSNICLVIAAYQDMFLNVNQSLIQNQLTSTSESIEVIATKKLVNFVMNLMQQYFKTVEQRFLLEDAGDNSMLVRALDRFHRRLQTMSNLLPDTNFARIGTDIVSRAARNQCRYHLQILNRHFVDSLTDVRQTLAASRSSNSSTDESMKLSTFLQDMLKSVQDQMKVALGNLQAFIQSTVTFSLKPYFREQFCKRDIREGLVVAFFRHVNGLAVEFCNSVLERATVPPALLLLLSRLCLDFESRVIAYLLMLSEEQFPIEDHSGITQSSQLCSETKEVAQKLLNHYVSVQGLTVSQMLRKSVETRDWMNTIEPRTVRAVMKRVVEDVTAIDVQVGQLYEEGTRREQSSDSSRSRRAFSHSTGRGGGATNNNRTNWSSYAPSTLDDSLLSNIHKLFSERIEIFSSVEFSKVSVLTGIVKISLKTFLECVRLRTFGRYGLQQIQVDTQYLQVYLWRFVSDENLVHVLLDEILSSAIHRCLEPTLMEPSVVEVICERG